MLEASVDDIEVVEERFAIRGSPASAGVTFEEVACEVYSNPHGKNMDGIEPMLQSVRQWKMPNVYHQPETQGRFSAYPSWPYGAAAAIVEVDPDTGHVKILRYLAVDDVGNVINPMIVDGMVHGGIAQGVAQALWEEAVYDRDSGQLVSGSMMDYTLPKADMLPFYETARTETPTPVNPLGVKGAGETGTIASTPAVVNAVVDALSGLGVDHIDAMPLTPERVWKTAQAAKSKK